MQRKQNIGFTLVELLIVISILSLLMQLALPAIQASREAARRTQCMNNMRQVALATSNYESAAKSFPPGFVLKPRHNFVQYILPNIEQQAIYELYDFSHDWNSEENIPATDNEITLLRCPTAPQDYPYLSDYAVCVKVGKDLQELLVSEKLIRERTDTIGILREGPVKAALVTDGLSNTILFCETAGRPDKYVLGQLIHIDTITGSRWGTPAGRFEINDRCDGSSLDQGSKLINCNSRNEIYSFHPNGANFVHADTSVHFLNEDIDPDVLISFVTASSGD